MFILSSSLTDLLFRILARFKKIKNKEQNQQTGLLLILYIGLHLNQRGVKYTYCL